MSPRKPRGFLTTLAWALAGLGIALFYIALALPVVAFQRLTRNVPNEGEEP